MLPGLRTGLVIRRLTPIRRLSSVAYALDIHSLPRYEVRALTTTHSPGGGLLLTKSVAICVVGSWLAGIMLPGGLLVTPAHAKSQTAKSSRTASPARSAPHLVHQGKVLDLFLPSVEHCRQFGVRLRAVQIVWEYSFPK